MCDVASYSRSIWYPPQVKKRNSLKLCHQQCLPQHKTWKIYPCCISRLSSCHISITMSGLSLPLLMLGSFLKYQKIYQKSWSGGNGSILSSVINMTFESCWLGTALFHWLYFDDVCPGICWLVPVETGSSFSLLCRHSLPPWIVQSVSSQNCFEKYSKAIRVNLNRGTVI